MKCILFALVIACVSVYIDAQACHLRELDLCAATLLLFNQNPSGVATTDAELDKQCGFLKEAQTCFSNFTTRCTTPLQRELINFGSEGSRKVFDDFCKQGTDIRKRYLKHAPCLGQTMPDQKKCLTEIQVGLEKISDAPFNDRVKTGCCTYQRYQDCTTNAIESKCGKEAVEFGQILIRMAASDLPDIVCQGFKNNPDCARLLPPPGTKPTGKSNSVLSRLFSAYLSN